MSIGVASLAVVQMSLAAVFLHAAAGKILRPATFLEGVRSYEVVPSMVAPVVVVVVIGAEVVIGAAQVVGVRPTLAAAAACVLLAVFTVAVAINLWRGNYINCHCGGGGDGETVSARSLGRLGLLMLAELVLLSEGGVSLPVYLDALGTTTGMGVVLFIVAVGLTLMTYSWAFALGELLTLARNVVRTRYLRPGEAL